MSQQPEEHWRVVSTLKNGHTVIQQPHFKSTDDAHAYIQKHRATGLIRPGEGVEVVRDFDTRIYPFWKPNHGI